MKKYALFVLAILLCVLTACNFSSRVTDNTGKTAMQEPEKIDEMLQALAEGDAQKAIALMHPEVQGRSDAAVEQMIEYLAGRKAESVEQINITVTNKTGAAGKMRQESAAFRVVLEDATQIYLSVNYLIQSDAKGFYAFQIVLGLV